MKRPTLLHATRWLSLCEVDGWVFASRRRPDDAPRIDAVNVVALHESEQQRRLVVIEEWREAVQEWEWALPAGLIDGGENVAAAGTRELQEETGLAATWAGPVSGRLFSSAGLTDETFAYWFCGCEGTPATTPGVADERIRVHLLDRGGCRALLDRNVHGAALSGRLWFILHGIAETGMAGAYPIQ